MSTAAEASPLPTLASSNVITSNNHGPYVTITASLMLVAMALLTGLRLSIRYPFVQLFGLDDAAVVISAVSAIAQSVLIMMSVDFGLGRNVNTLTDNMQVTAQKLVYASNVLFVVSLSLSKTATSLLMARLTRARNQVIAAYVTSAIIMIWGMAFILGVTVSCHPNRPWDMRDNRCTNWQAMWTAFGGVGVFFEILLAVLPAYLLWGLQMSPRCKATVAFGFCFRLLIIPIEGYRLVALHNSLNSTNPTFDIVPLAIFTQIEQHYSLIAATIPCLRPFLKAANTGLLTIDPAQVEQCGTYLSGGNSSYGGKSFGSSGNHDKRSTRVTVVHKFASRPSLNGLAQNPPRRSSNGVLSADFSDRSTTQSTNRPMTQLSNNGHRPTTQLSSRSATTRSTNRPPTRTISITVPEQRSPTTTATTLRSKPSLDSFSIATGPPMSTSPTIAKHMTAASSSSVRPAVTARAAAVATAGSSSPLHEDATSLVSDDGSERLIIRKDTDFDVHYSPIVPTAPGSPGAMDVARVLTGESVGRGVPQGIPGIALERVPTGGGGGGGRPGAWLEVATPFGRGSPEDGPWGR